MAKTRLSTHRAKNRNSGKGINGRGHRSRLAPIDNHVQIMANRHIGGGAKAYLGGNGIYEGGVPGKKCFYREDRR
jgi:hypothetical protein